MVLRSPSPEQSTQIVTLARDTAMHAQSYLAVAARAASGMSPMEKVDARMPLNFLLGHACELALKSMLINSGYEDPDLKKISHHLDRAMKACRDEGLTIEAEFEEFCGILGPAHGEYLSRYAIRTFPWVDYDQAVAMIEPQMKRLPWVWPSSIRTEIAQAAEPVSLQSAAQDFKNATNLSDAREKFQRSAAGVGSAELAYDELKKSIVARVQQIKDATGVADLAAIDTGGILVVAPLNGRSLLVNWRRRYSNTLEGACLEVEYYLGFPPHVPGYPTFEEPAKLSSAKYTYGLIDERTAGYFTEGKGSCLTWTQVADQILSRLIELARPEK